MNLARTAVEKIAERVEAVGLPEHQHVLYRRPRTIQPGDCPLLVVWFIAKEPNLTGGTTDRFDNVMRIGVSWHEETVDEAQTLIDNPEISVALMDALERIETASRKMSKDGLGDDRIYEVLPGASAYVPPEMEEGLVEGVVHEVLCRVSEVS